jgi:FixJ family two-component response regulator
MFEQAQIRRQAMVYVVDDDEAVRRAVSLVLEIDGWSCTTFADAQSFLDDFGPTQPGCLILDVRLPGPSGLDLQATLEQKHWSIPIIFITGHGDVPMSVRAIKAGAVDFLEKPFRNDLLLDRVEEAVQVDVEQRAQQARKRSIALAYETLTPREREVMGAVVQGRSNKQIAAALLLSHRTVEIHRARVMEKMGASSLPDLVAMAMVCGAHELNQAH